MPMHVYIAEEISVVPGHGFNFTIKIKFETGLKGARNGYYHVV